ncbi:MAG: hypothetical protein EX271_06260 [Acidimicrobiales bacterium]|nr:hypothetical protein [Hyphomonadaceae bacterium]RZV42282.1 MAG: hypothetical protein EX271_06260 [Acidimicrobiales bacterium]
MLDLMNEFQQHIKDGPTWVEYWVNFMGFVFMLAIPFSFVRKEARWVVITMVVTMVVMMLAFKHFGYERILGAVHIIVWAPLLVYLFKRKDKWQVKDTWSGKWIVLLIATMLTSLAFDITDVVRYFLGHSM